jgi:starch synthase
MACGLPVVAAAAPGIPDILIGGPDPTGILAPPGDARRFAEALGLILDNPGMARELGEAARLRARTAFSLEAVGSQLRDFLMRGGLRV